ncbi:MAG: hypothetical protein ACLFN5_07055 [bacterium]
MQTGENQQDNSKQSDPWEEEIDLRELVRGIAKKWYIWLGLPLLVMVIVAGYLYLFTTITPSYRLDAGFYYDDLTFADTEARSLLPDKGALTRRLRSVSRYGPLFGEIFSEVLEFDDEAELRSVFQEVEREKADFSVNKRGVFLEVETSYPQLATEFLNRYFESVMESEAERILNARQRRLEKIKDRRTGIIGQHDKWLQAIDARIEGDVQEIIENGEGEESGVYPARFRRARELLPVELEILQTNHDFLERILNIEQRIYELEQFPKDSGEYFEYYAPDEPLEIEEERTRRRDTLLAGAVTFLLALFATAFWEIL